MEDAETWKARYANGESIVAIAASDKTDPKLVSSWLRKLGVEVIQGHHRVRQRSLELDERLVKLATSGPDNFIEFVESRVWGLQISEKGMEQLIEFCKFVRMHEEGAGVLETAAATSEHRATILQWRKGMDKPYLVEFANSMLDKSLTEGWKWLPLHLVAGGGKATDWIEVPESITSYEEISKMLSQLKPVPTAFERCSKFGIKTTDALEMRPELFAHSLGMLLGDAGKGGGRGNRFASMRMDLQLSRKEASNERLAEFVAMSLNLLGLKMERISDKPPTGATKNAEEPTPSYRWTSEGSPLIAWMFRVGLGLDWNEKTSLDGVKMEWMLTMPRQFRRRFIQGLADSDGTVRNYTVEIASMPNAVFVTNLLRSVGMKTAHVLLEGGTPMRSCVHSVEAWELPIFNEFVQGYRYQTLMHSRGLQIARGRA